MQAVQAPSAMAHGIHDAVDIQRAGSEGNDPERVAQDKKLRYGADRGLDEIGGFQDAAGGVAIACLPDADHCGPAGRAERPRPPPRLPTPERRSSGDRASEDPDDEVVVGDIFFVAPGRLRYRVVSGGLEVATLLGVKSFPTAGCTARSHRPRVGMRLWGTGAPGYYTGTYRVDGANTKLYTTSIEEGVLIEGPGVRVFVNPENEAAFLDAIRSTGGATA